MSSQSKRRHLALALCFLATITACSRGGSDPLKWTEDVRLPDGRVVKLERYTDFAGEPSVEFYQQLTFKHPATGDQVKWENTRATGRLGTVALWMHEGKALLLTTPLYGDDDFFYKCPNPPYLLYEYVQGQWVRKPLAEVGLDQVRSNMTAHPLDARPRIRNRRHHLGVDETSNSYTNRDGTHPVPYILTFRNLPAQVLDESCPHRKSPLNFLLLNEGK